MNQMTENSIVLIVSLAVLAFFVLRWARGRMLQNRARDWPKVVGKSAAQTSKWKVVAITSLSMSQTSPIPMKFRKPNITEFGRAPPSSMARRKAGSTSIQWAPMCASDMTRAIPARRWFSTAIRPRGISDGSRAIALLTSSP